MYLSKLRELAGGIGNLTRVTLDDDKIYLTLKDPELLDTSEIAVHLEYFNGEWVVSAKRMEPVLEADLNEIGQLIDRDLRQKVSDYLIPTKCEFRPSWHIAPPQGLLNDPNGFIWHAGEYHLFYQWYPYECMHKDKYWVHLKSSDLVNWRWSSIALTPSSWCDSHGVFSGHALSHDGDLLTFYTGNTRIGMDRLRQTTQCCAKLREDGAFEKLGPVIRELPPGVTPHFRDPKVIKWRDRWIMFIGAQREDLIGRLAVYHSSNLVDWEYKGLFGDELGDFGYMWECPDVFQIDEQYYLIFAPQGIESGNPHHTTPHHNRICCLDLNEDGLPSLSNLQILDYGFDFYAPQSLETPDGRRVLCSWLGLPDEVNQPSVANGWIHQISAFRELKFEKGKLVQQPIQELSLLRSERKDIEISNDGTDLNSKAFELHVTLAAGETLSLFKTSNISFDITFNLDSKTLIVNRENTLIQEGDTIREFLLSQESSSVALQIIADQSSIEIFVNQGEAVISSRVFTPKDATKISCSTVNDKAKSAYLYYLTQPHQPYCYK
jgi:beta-fructofuranosidase